MTRRAHYQSDANASIVKVFDALRADFEAARENRWRKRLTGAAAMGSGADWHVRMQSDWLRMIERAREFDRNDPVVGQGITRLINNVYQEEGFSLDPQTGDDKADDALSARWLDWSGDASQCDVARERDFNDCARMVMRAAVVDGDIFALHTDDGSLEHLEAHRCRTPYNARGSAKGREKRGQRVVQGVLLSKTRQHLEYWFTKDELDPNRALTNMGDVRRVPVYDREGRRQAWQIANPRRASQTRGVNFMAPIVDPVSFHGDLQWVKMIQAKAVSCYAIIHQLTEGATGAAPGQTGERTTETRADGSQEVIEEIQPGLVIRGKPGETVTGFSPNVPNPEFFPHSMLLLTLIAINLNLPLAVLLLDPSKTNFSGWRGAMDQARAGFRVLQKWMIKRYHRPVYRWKVAEWVDDDKALKKLADKSKVSIFGHRWNPPSWAYIEPNKDANADASRLHNRLISLRRVHSERGRDWKEVSKEIVADNKEHIELAIMAATELNARYSDAKVDWREIAAMGKANQHASGLRERSKA
jgi:lambda family phage portal protein